ncbi:hypothetical protein D6D05_04843 [Aureobasidium pullulans]|nr:hypothetical protein D6D05_04843 [Aureobasidium pullulans]
MTMSELLDNFNPELLMIPIAEQGSTVERQTELPTPTDGLDFDFSDMDLAGVPDFDIGVPTVISDIPTGGLDFTPCAIPGPSQPDANPFGYNNAGLPYFGQSNFGQYAPAPMMPQQYMPTYAPQYQYAYPPFGYQPPPGYMLVPTANFYGQPMMPMMQAPMPMPMQAPGFSFTPAPEAPTYPAPADNDVDMSGVPSTPLRRSGENSAGKKTTYQDPTSPSRDATPAKRQKRTLPKVARPAIELKAPISVLTADLGSPKDMLAFANRSIAVRHAEAAKRGKTPRPLNRFVCYRSAYSDLTTKWASSSDHRNISCILGASWKIEPQSIINQFDKIAALDFANHMKAFPTYKYLSGQSRGTKPVKPRTTPRPKKQRQPKKYAGRPCARPVCPESDDNEMTPIPQSPTITLNDEDVMSEGDDEMADLFGGSSPSTPKFTRGPTPSPTPSRYNLRHRQISTTVFHRTPPSPISAIATSTLGIADRLQRIIINGDTALSSSHGRQCII